MHKEDLWWRHCHTRVNTPVCTVCMSLCDCIAECFVRLNHISLLCPAGLPRDKGWRAAAFVSRIVPQLFFWQYYPFMEHRRSEHHPQPKRHQQCEICKLKTWNKSNLECLLDVLTVQKFGVRLFCKRNNYFYSAQTH